jgi:hypothetical protein
MEPTPRKYQKKTSKNSDKLKSTESPMPSGLINEDYKKLQLVKEINNEQLNSLINMESFISEFLEDFIILGHAIDGARIAISHTRSPKDADSLEQLYTDYLISIKSKKYNGLN